MRLLHEVIVLFPGVRLRLAGIAHHRVGIDGVHRRQAGALADKMEGSRDEEHEYRPPKNGRKGHVHFESLMIELSRSIEWLTQGLVKDQANRVSRLAIEAPSSSPIECCSSNVLANRTGLG